MIHRKDRSLKGVVVMINYRVSSFTPSVVPNWPILAKGAILVGGSAVTIYGGYKALITKA